MSQYTPLGDRMHGDNPSPVAAYTLLSHGGMLQRQGQSPEEREIFLMISRAQIFFIIVHGQEKFWYPV